MTNVFQIGYSLVCHRYTHLGKNKVLPEKTKSCSQAGYKMILVFSFEMTTLYDLLLVLNLIVENCDIFF